jgi:hypothetical protein
MSKVGVWLIIFGVGSFLLNMAGMEFRLLMWIDTWGSTVGNLIRGGLVVAGAGLVAADRLAQSKTGSKDE